MMGVVPTPMYGPTPGTVSQQQLQQQHQYYGLQQQQLQQQQLQQQYAQPQPFLQHPGQPSSQASYNFMIQGSSMAGQPYMAPVTQQNMAPVTQQNIAPVNTQQQQQSYST